MSFASGAFFVLDAFAIALTVLPLLPSTHWVSRAPEFPRLQIACLIAVLLALQAALQPDGFALHALPLLLLAACLVYQLIWIAPYTPLFPREVRNARKPLEERRCIAVFVANVLMSNRNAPRLHALIAAANPDVVVLLETSRWWQERLQPLRTAYPHGMDCPLENRYGMHLYSRLPLEDPELEFLVEDGVPSMHAGVRLRSGDCVRLHALHPAPPSPTENATSRERDAELLVVGRAVREAAGPVIVTGDFNDVAWSPTTRLFRKISRLLDPRIGRGMFNTFHAQLPLLRFPLDHVFHSDDFTLIALEVLPDFGSDHRPIHYILQYEPAAQPAQQAPQADSGDKAQAGRKMRAGGTAPDEVPQPRD